MRMTVTSSNKVAKTISVIRAAAWVLVEETAEVSRLAAVEAIQTSVGSGHKYPNLPNRSSAPSEIPVNQTGALAASMRTYVGKRRANGVPYAEFGSDDPVARDLDLGTNRVAPRPFMSKAADVGKRNMEEAAPKMARLAKNV